MSLLLEISSVICSLLRNKLWRYYRITNSSEHWENYRAQRNLCTKLRRKLIANQCRENARTTSSKDFWSSFGNMMHCKTKSSDGEIVLTENNTITNDKGMAATFINNFFAKAATDIGLPGPDINTDYTKHPSVSSIHQDKI